MWTRQKASGASAPAGGGSRSGAASAIPAATASGSLYYANDIGIVYRDAAAGVWDPYLGSAYVGPSPAVASAWTLVGGLLMQQRGPALQVQSTNGSIDAEALQPFAGSGVDAGGPWTLELHTESFFNGTFPAIGPMVSNGVTPVTSLGFFTGTYQYGNDVQALGTWQVYLASQNRPVAVGDNTAHEVSRRVRLVSIGTDFISQWRPTTVTSWRTFNVQPRPAAFAPPTHFGLSAGVSNGAGSVSATIHGLKMAVFPSVAIVAATYSASDNRWHITSATPHGLRSGQVFAIAGAQGSSIPPVGYLDGQPNVCNLIVESATTFSYGGASGNGAFVYTGDGAVFNLA